MKLLLFLAFAIPLAGQRQSGELRLVVADPAGAGLQASVELVSQANDRREHALADPGGRYVARDLPLGPYRLHVAHDGFAPFTAMIEIRSEVPVERKLTLGLTPVETTITITDSNTLLDPARTGLVFHVGQDTLRSRRSALPSRSVLELVNTQPGWLLEANGVLHPRGSEYDTQYVIDGIPILDNRSPAFAPAFEAEELDSMKIMTANYPAEYGRKMGGVVELVTARESSPGFHGKAVWQAGSFGTQSGHLGAGYLAGRTNFSLSGEASRTDRFLDPPVERNFTNRSSAAGLTARAERDLTDRDRIRFYVHRKRLSFLVPNELVQQEAGQRQDRRGEETMGQASFQRVLSPQWLFNLRGMVRDVSADLWSNPLATPISAGQDRGFREAYFSGSLAAAVGSHSLKFGTEGVLTRVRERFGYRITDAEFFSEDGELEFPPQFEFRGRRAGREHSLYIQDLVRAGNFTFGAGIRWDRYRLIVRDSFLSPRLGAAWHVPSLGLVVRASYDRAVSIPAIENLLLASSNAARSLTDETTGLPVEPSRGDFYEVGFSKSLRGRLRLDGAYFRRNIRHYADDDVFLNTGISFPISFDRAAIRGFEARLELPRWRGWSGVLSWSNLAGTGFLPITGGLFLEEDAGDLLTAAGSFPISQDQRNTVQARVRRQIHPRIWAAAGFWYNSGLPVEREGELEDDEAFQDTESLRERFGDRVVDRVDFRRGRVKPSHGVDLSVSADLWKRERQSLALQADVLNLANRLNVINFAGLFSGTALGAPRSFNLRLQARF